MMVFEFRCHFPGLYIDAESRFVVAQNEDEAWKKIDTHFDDQETKGYARPVFIDGPYVELDNVIV